MNHPQKTPGNSLSFVGCLESFKDLYSPEAVCILEKPLCKDAHQSTWFLSHTWDFKVRGKPWEIEFCHHVGQWLQGSFQMYCRKKDQYLLLRGNQCWVWLCNKFEGLSPHLDRCHQVWHHLCQLTTVNLSFLVYSHLKKLEKGGVEKPQHLSIWLCQICQLNKDSDAPTLLPTLQLLKGGKKSHEKGSNYFQTWRAIFLNHHPNHGKELRQCF